MTKIKTRRKEENKMSDNITVHITTDAYLEMLGHVLEYGNTGMKQTYDVLGICMGKLEGSKLTINKTFPVKHGVSVDRPFSEVDLIAINENIPTTPEQYKVGWYRSHGKMGFYMSQSDKKNQLEFQTPEFPQGVFLTFDFEKITDEDPFGLKVFKLDNISQGHAAGFFEVPFEVEMPGMKVYKYLNQYLCSLQRREPIVKETGTQLDAGEDLFSGGFATEKKISEDLKNLQEYINSISKNADSSFFSDFIKKIAEFQDGMTKLSNESGFNNDNIINLKEAISDGLINVNTWMDEKMKETIAKNQGQLNSTLQDLTQSYENQKLELAKALKAIIAKISKN